MQPALFWALIGVAALAAAAFGLYFLNRPATLARALVKTAFMGALAAAFAGQHPLLLIALCAAGVGDFFLAIEKPWALPIGMVAFVIMQFCYAFIFILLWLLSGDNSPHWPRIVLTALTLLMVLAYLVWFWREPREKRAPLLAFAAIAAAMAIGAAPVVVAGAGYLATMDVLNVDPNINWPLLGLFFAACVGFIWLRRDLGTVRLAGMVYAAVVLQMALVSFWLPWVAWPVMAGAVLFLISDGVLSAELFRLTPDSPSRRVTTPVVWWTYVGAQALIVWGMSLAARAMV